MSGRQSLKLPFEQPIATYDIGLDSTATIFQILVKRCLNTVLVIELTLTSD